MTGKTVKISLLTLQKILIGEISYDDFARDHQLHLEQLRRLDSEGLMISSIEIDPAADSDDDWVTLTFGEKQPKRLFENNVF